MSHYDDAYEEYYADRWRKTLAARKAKYPNQYNTEWTPNGPLIRDCWYDKNLTHPEILELLNKSNNITESQK